MPRHIWDHPQATRTQNNSKQMILNMISWSEKVKISSLLVLCFVKNGKTEQNQVNSRQRHVNLKEFTLKWFVNSFKTPPVARRNLGGIQRAIRMSLLEFTCSGLVLKAFSSKCLQTNPKQVNSSKLMRMAFQIPPRFRLATGGVLKEFTKPFKVNSFKFTCLCPVKPLKTI